MAQAGIHGLVGVARAMQKCGSQAIAREKTQDVGLANSFATIL